MLLEPVDGDNSAQNSGLMTRKVESCQSAVSDANQPKIEKNNSFNSMKEAVKMDFGFLEDDDFFAGIKD